MPRAIRGYGRRTSRSFKSRSRTSGRRRATRKPRRTGRVNRKAQLSYMGPGAAPLPDKYFTKLRYSDWINVASSGTTGVYDNTYSGNSAYDPLAAVGGSGCSGFTELASIYNQYRVYASKISIQVKSITDVTATGDFMVMVIPDRSGTAYTMANTIARQGSPFAKIKMVNRYANGGSPTFITSFRKTKNIYGESDIDDDNYAAATGADPTNEWFWHVIMARGDQSSISAYPGFQMHVKITYYVRFEKRAALNAP